MKAIRVAIPLLKSSGKFHLFKGKPWSLIDHMVLQALSEASLSVAQLAEESNLPKRVIIEVLVRLMRVGWIELLQRNNEVTFSASESGREYAGQQDLPSAMKSLTRWMSFYVDRVTGTAYTRGDFFSLSRKAIEERYGADAVRYLRPAKLSSSLGEDPRDLLACLSREDEEITHIEMNAQRPVELYALVSVQHEKIEGLPTRAPKELAEEILRAAGKSAPDKDVDKIEKSGVNDSQESSYVRDISLHSTDAVFSMDDLVLGGAAHEAALNAALLKARSRVIIHSTFVREERLKELLPLFKQAISRRNIKIDLLWGKSDSPGEENESRTVMRAFQADLMALGLESSIRVHLFSTDSHSKLLICDDQPQGGFSAIVGSCNWLYSQFSSYEASIRCRDPQLVSDVLNALSALSRGRSGGWSELTGDLAQLSVASFAREKPKGRRAKCALVSGLQHRHCVYEARDNAKNIIFIASHRLSEVADRSIILPALAAVAAQPHMDVKVYYGRISGKMTNTDVSNLTLSSRGEGVQIAPIFEPRLHAKMLSWDDNSLVISSHNWLSAESSNDRHHSELGIYVNFDGVGRSAIESFNAALITG